MTIRHVSCKDTASAETQQIPLALPAPIPLGTWVMQYAYVVCKERDLYVLSRYDKMIQKLNKIQIGGGNVVGCLSLLLFQNCKESETKHYSASSLCKTCSTLCMSARRIYTIVKKTT